ncbi:nuclear transport factor 2 family protein [Microbacterium abyssi]|uniref:nuclear transport factor 2 family protein n=1 Tax=Microbacterium abyssi TaxID=2782166 RepID=UPI001E42206C|nr:nuclear transport factor 2 family protein [Microbacterium sp. A18JL241]
MAKVRCSGAVEIYGFAETYLDAVSNERDPNRRREAIDRLFDVNMRYIDQDGSASGRDAFTRRIDDLAAMMTPTARFELQRPAQYETDCVLFRWQLAEPGNLPLVAGAEVAVFTDGRVVSLYSIVD